MAIPRCIWPVRMDTLVYMQSATPSTDVALTIAIEILYYLLTVIQLAPLDLRVSIINLKNRSGNTSLHWAALNGHLEAVKILVAAGADPSMTNHTGHDAVYEAEINSNEAVVEWLLKEGMGLETGVSGEENSAATNDQAGEGEDYPAEYESSTPTTILADEEDDRGINRRAEGLSIG